MNFPQLPRSVIAYQDIIEICINSH